MNYLKASIGTILILIMLLLVMIYFSFDSSYLLKKSFKKASSGKYAQAEEYLLKTKNSISSYKYHLYSGYLNSLDNEMELSNKELSKALYAAHKNNYEDKDLLELYLLKAFNELEQKDFKECKDTLLLAKNISSKSNYLKYLEAMLLYETEEYSAALNIWPTNQQPQYLSCWQSILFESRFNPKLLGLYRTHCQIETEPSEIIDIQIPDSLSEYEFNFYNFLAGISILKDNEDKIPYIEEALVHFDKINLEKNNLAKEWGIIFDKLYYSFIKMAEEERFEECLVLVKHFEKWQATETLEKVTDKIFKIIDIKLKEDPYLAINFLQINSSIASIIEQPTIEKNLSPKIYDKIITSLNLNDDKLAWEYWHLLEKTSSEISTYKNLSKTIIRQIKTLASNSSQNIENIQTLASFFERFEQNHSTKLKLALNILTISKDQWIIKSQTTKSLELIKIAHKLSSRENEQEIFAIIKEDIHKRFLNAKRNDDIERLSLLKEILDYFNLEQDNFISQSDISNILDDAKYYCRSARYQDAFIRAGLVHILDPQRPEALNILGSIAYVNDDYDLAEKVLSKIENPSINQEEALAVCKTCNKKSDGYHKLIEIKNIKKLSDRALMALGYWSLDIDNNEKAIDWLSQINGESDEKSTLLCHAYYNLGQPQEALDNFFMTSPSHQEIKALKNIAIISNLMVKEKELDNNIINLLESQKESDHYINIPKKLRSFYNKDQNIIPLSIAKYFENKSQYEEALNYISTSAIPSNRTSLKKSALLIKMKQHTTAMNILEEVLQNDKAIEEHPAANFMIASILIQKNAFEDAITHLEKALNKQTENNHVLTTLNRCHQMIDQEKTFQGSSKGAFLDFFYDPNIRLT